MAERITAITAYSPRIVLGSTVKKDELVELIAGRSGLNRGDIAQVLEEFSNALIFFHRAGRGVRLDGLGTFSPRTGLDGRIRVGYRPDPMIRRQLNQTGYFLGQIAHRENIGKTADDLVSQWNTDNPNDPVS